MAKSPAKKKAVAKKRTPRVRVQKPTEDSTVYFAQLEVNEKLYEAQGETALEALQKFTEIPKFFVKTRAILRMRHNNLSSEHAFNVIQLRKFLINKIAKIIWAKRLEAAFKHD